MELYSVSLKSYKTKFWLVATICAVITITSWIMVGKGYFMFSPVYGKRNIDTIILATLILASFLHGQQQKNRLQKLQATEDFDEKIIMHQRLYSYRYLWAFVVCSTACLLYVSSGDKWFLFLTIFYLLATLLSWPKKRIIKIELQNEEIIFLE